MSDIAIKVEGLSKRYRIGALQEHNDYRTLREALHEKALAPFRAARHLIKGNGNGKVTRPAMIGDATANGNGSCPTIWALKDVSFEVKRGEVLGIIGRNGAGKSTLLKILARITEPTDGYADITGRLASLLEVGTGFHPELTGRENIFLNGSILGMRRAEIHSKFDEIVAFAEVEKFIDTPVKYYSSGMYVRLAFAVAAHLDPEILLVDEVLAVGDAAFQKKCLGKMGDVAKEGRTVLFVSHNMAAVNRLCGRGICLDQGTVTFIGGTEEAVGNYLGADAEFNGERRWEFENAPGSDEIRLLAVRLRNGKDQTIATVDVRQPVQVEIEYELCGQLPRFRTALRLVAADGTVVLTSSDSSDDSWGEEIRPPGIYVHQCELPGDFLNIGQYSLTVSADIPLVRELFLIESCLNFHVEQTGSHSGRFPEKWPGLVCPKLPWAIRRRDRTTN